MIYEIIWAEVGQTSTGKTKATLTLKGENGVEIDKVTAWGDFPGFTALQPGQKVLGDIQTKINGKFTNKTLYPERTNTLNKPSYTRSPSAIATAMKKKEESIAHAQENRAEGVKVASTFRDATLITVEWIKKQSVGQTLPSDEFIQEEWLKWRAWLWKNWDANMPPF